MINMKAIELTESHKEKLLEMCKKLFPEYTFITFQESSIMGAGWEYDFNNICFSKKSDSLFDIEINIHWFEFCLMHIVPKLLKSHLDKEEFYLYINDSNPINYLYKYFKN